MTKKDWKLAGCFYLFALLPGCASDMAQTANGEPTVPLEQILSRCLAVVGAHGGPTPAPDSLTESQWAGYAGCAIGSNLRVDIDQVAGNPQATVEIEVDDDGSVISIKRLRSSGNLAWDRAVDRSIGATPVLAPAPTARHFSKLDVNFGPFSQGVTLTGRKQGATHLCGNVYNPTVCN